ncbi:MFS transporter, putative [Bodo saltans]|uniref:MFS transporter, putative n=1 Tax=Bodo saltans TaxID=75058 RepID=A0A0S4IKT9_BODSA|nr:MFS transporter, putative [Bodo saltans]|eukprot:CUE66679.1 MFS transporter, putative [Bodo saltans]
MTAGQRRTSRTSSPNTRRGRKNSLGNVRRPRSPSPQKSVRPVETTAASATISHCLEEQQQNAPPTGSVVGNLFYLSIFFDLFAVATVVPFLADHSRHLDVPPSLMGVVQALYGLMQTLSTPVLGTLCDVYGPRRILLVSVGGTALSYCVLSWALWKKSIFWFVASRVLIGTVRQTMSVGSTFVSVGSTFVVKSARSGLRSSSSSQNKGSDVDAVVAKGMGTFQAAASLGFVFGPAVGGVIGDRFGVVVGSLVAAGVDGVNLLLMWKATQHADTVLSLPHEQEEETHSSRKKSGNPVKLFFVTLLRCDVKSALLGSLYLSSLGHIVLQTSMPLLVRRGFGLSGTSTGLLFSLWSGLNVVMMASVPRFLSAGAPPGRDGRIVVSAGILSLFGHCLMLIALLLGGVGSSSPQSTEATEVPHAVWCYAIGLGVVALSYGVGEVIKRSCFSTMFPTDVSGEVMSIVFSLEGANRVVAPIIVGFLLPPMRPLSDTGSSIVSSEEEVLHKPALFSTLLILAGLLLGEVWRWKRRDHKLHED